jgi:hypothetical protein
LIDSTRIVASISFGRANRGLLAEALCDGGGGCIACDRNEVEECFSTCGHQPTNGANWPKKGRDWCGGVEEASAGPLIENYAPRPGSALASEEPRAAAISDSTRIEAARRQAFREISQQATDHETDNVPRDIVPLHRSPWTE